MEVCVLLLFAAALLACILSGINVSVAMGFGLLLFTAYARRRGFAWREIGRMLCTGVGKVANILVVFVCIGSLTAAWRISGTIPYIVHRAAGLIVPRYFVLCAFALCCALSFMTGSSFSTAGTVGAICMLLGRATGVAELPLAGAILAGSFFGDRSSPMSTSALLVADVTGTDIYDNLRAMFRTAVLPLALTCLIYLFVGGEAENGSGDALAVLERSFVLAWPAMIPAVITLLLCALRVEVKRTMLISAAAGVVIAVWLQGAPLTEVLRVLVLGYSPAGDPELSALLSGGGVVSMTNVAVIVCLSSSFSGVFEKTGLLDGMGRLISRLARRTTGEVAFTAVATATAVISCNQTLATLLTDQLMKPVVPDGKRRALYLEDTTIVIAPLIPWSIACTVPLAIMEAEPAAIAYASYLYLLPLIMMLRSLLHRKR